MSTVVVLFGLSGLASVGETSSSTSSWYADLGPTGLNTSAVTYVDGLAYNTPVPTAAGMTEFTRDTGATGYAFGVGVCADVRYGNSSFTEAKAVMMNVLGLTGARAENFVRASLLDLCPA